MIEIKPKSSSQMNFLGTCVNISSSRECRNTRVFRTSHTFIKIIVSIIITLSRTLGSFGASIGKLILVVNRVQEVIECSRYLQC